MSIQLSKAYSARGAQMGRRHYGTPRDNELCNMHRVPLDGGGYDGGGAYWGHPSDLWRLTYAEGEWFTRASSRFAAFCRFTEHFGAKGSDVSFRVRP